MKYLKLLTLACVLFVSCNDTSVHIHGTVTGTSDKNELFLTRGGDVIESLQVNPDNTFNLEIKDLEKGYYALHNIPIYLTPGARLEVSIQKDTTIFKGIGADENVALQNVFLNEKKYSITLRGKHDLDLDAFKAYLNKHVTWVDKEVSNKNLDSDFVEMEKIKANYFLKAALLPYASSHGVDNKIFNEAMKYLDPKDPEKMKVFDSLRIISFKNKYSKERQDAIRQMAFEGFDLNNETLFLAHSTGYKSLLNGKITSLAYEVMNEAYKSAKDKNKIPGVIVFKRDIIVDSIKSKVIKDVLLKNNIMTIIKTQPKYAKVSYDIYKESNPTERNLNEIKEVYNNLMKMAKGSPSPKFINYKTPKDERVSLEDFKGKYVYIDVWATWCGPCKKEIPYLKAVEKQFHDRNVEFVSISVDVEESRQKWKDMVKDMELGGVQIMADKDFSSDFVKAYNIAAIPRFILIDPNGKIVSSNAPRPSDSELVKLFNKLKV